MQPGNMGPGRKLLNIFLGDRSMEDYARVFIGVARQSATEKACFMVFFWGGLAELFKSRMPYWHPEESLGGVHRPGSEFKRLSLQDGVRPKARSIPRAHRVRS